MGRQRLLSLWLALLWLALLVPAAHAQQLPQVPLGPAARGLLTDGSTVLWAEESTLKVLSGQTISVLTTQLYLDDYAISAGRVVWVEGASDNRAIKLASLSNRTQTTIATGQVAGPTIQGDLAWWWELGEQALLRQRNVRTLEPAITISTQNYGIWGSEPSALQSNRDWLVWCLRISKEGYSNIYAMPMGGGPPVVAGGFYTLCESHQIAIGAEGDIVAAHNGSTLMILHLNSQLREVLAIRSGVWLFSGQLAVDQHMVFYQRGFRDSAHELWGLELSSRSRAMIARQEGAAELAPAAGGGLLVWKGQGAGQATLKSARIDAVRPAGRPVPAPLPRDTIYFPETGHTLGGVFKSYWEQNGGLAVFGYPLSDQLEEINQDTGVAYQVQYFERQRFEHHPENRGTPYEVLLGRLGNELLGGENSWRQLPKASPDAPHYFPQTEHAIAPEFWGYWSGRGLDLGDPGISERESLALFGYPLSEPKLETNSSGDHVLTQHFERARFELHPDNPEPYRVLLGRLGAEVP